MWKRHTWEKTMRKVRPEFSKLGGTCYDPSEQRRNLIEANERYRQRLKLALQAKLESTKGILGYIDGIAKVRTATPKEMEGRAVKEERRKGSPVGAEIKSPRRIPEFHQAPAR